MSRHVGYGSHVPTLVGAFLRTNGPVLELGAGDHSTPLLHELAKGIRDSTADRRRLYTLESDPVWFAAFEALQSETHEIRHVTDWKTCELIDDRVGSICWDLIFIDHDPPRRAIELARLKHKHPARFIVVHDTEPEERKHHPGLEETLALFRFRRDFTDLLPWTTVVSDVGPIW